MFIVGYILLFSIYFTHIHLFSVYMHFALNFKCISCFKMVSTTETRSRL